MIFIRRRASDIRDHEESRDAQPSTRLHHPTPTTLTTSSSATNFHTRRLLVVQPSVPATARQPATASRFMLPIDNMELNEYVAEFVHSTGSIPRQTGEMLEALVHLESDFERAKKHREKYGALLANQRSVAIPDHTILNEAKAAENDLNRIWMSREMRIRECLSTFERTLQRAIVLQESLDSAGNPRFYNNVNSHGHPIPNAIRGLDPMQFQSVYADSFGSSTHIPVYPVLWSEAEEDVLWTIGTDHHFSPTTEGWEEAAIEIATVGLQKRTARACQKHFKEMQRRHRER